MNKLPFTLTLLVLVGVQAAVLGYWLNYPLLDEHAFRQTQTALTAYWLLKDFDLLHYITPVLGAPWAIPFEFPLYQLFVALLAEFFPYLGFDAAGRIVSWCFSIASVYPLARIVTRYAQNETAGLTAACFYLACPFYLFWGRTAMIESTALFFSLMCLWWFICLGDSPSWRFAALATLSGICAALVKVTTIPAYMLAGYAHIFCIRRKTALFNRDAILFILPGTLSLLAVYLWQAHADQVKMLNDIASKLTSVNLSQWNFGTLAQRLSADTWHRLIQRIFKEILSPPGTIALVLGAAAFFRVTPGLNKLFAAASLVVFALPLLIFTNLHYVHNYYQTACAIALLASFAFLISPRNGNLGRYHAAAVILISIFLVSGFVRYPKRIEKALQNETLAAAEIVRLNTPQDSAILVYGYDWSSEIPYYAQRKALVSPNWREGELPNKSTDDILKARLGGLPMSALIVRNFSMLPERDQDQIALILATVSIRFERHDPNVSVYILEPGGTP